MKALKIILLTFFLLCSSYQASAQKKVTAENANEIVFSQDGSNAVLTFDGIKNGKQIWIEKWQGQTFSYTETSHDEYSIYMKNQSKGWFLQVDLVKRQIIFDDGSGKKIPLQIKSVKSS